MKFSARRALAIFSGLLMFGALAVARPDSGHHLLNTYKFGLGARQHRGIFRLRYSRCCGPARLLVARHGSASDGRGLGRAGRLYSRV